MAQNLPPHFLELVADAALKSFWRRRALNDFLRRCGISQSFLGSWEKDESKRDFLFRLFPQLETSPKGPAVISHMATSLIEQSSFPDLEGWEDSAYKQRRAKEAVAAVKAYVKTRNEEVVDALQQAEARKHSAKLRQERALKQKSLDNLSARLNELATRDGDQQAGYDFQDWFFDLADYFEVVCRRPYTVAGRQIDGSITVDGTTYLTEMKFTAEQADAPDIDVFFKKVHEKADNTMGIMVSISGYSSVAVNEASKSRTPLLLIDFNHIYLILNGSLRLDELVNRLRRHCSQTGTAYLHPQDF
jgi:hypothetical protein